MQENEQLKNSIKQAIKQLIETGKLTEAGQLLFEYEKNLPSDCEVYSMKAVIAILKDNNAEGIDILQQGLNINPCNADLLYNLAYAYEQKGEFTKAIYYYKQSHYYSNNNITSSEALMSIERIKQKAEYLQQVKRKTSIIILLSANEELNRLCIDNIRKYTEHGTYELVIVFDGIKRLSTTDLELQEDIISIDCENNVSIATKYNKGIGVAKGNSILLMDSSIIVTSNWLSNLRAALFSSDDIFAAGAINNINTPGQYNYSNIEELHSFAGEYNKSNANSWLSCLCITSSCLLIKRKAFYKIGNFEENFIHSQFVQDDYVFRLRQNGYKTLLCKDTFVHHMPIELSEQEKQQMYTDQILFYKKWNVDVNYPSFIQKQALQGSDILYLGRGCAATLSYIKSILPTVKCFGFISDKNYFKDENITVINTLEPYADLEKRFEKRQFDIIIVDFEFCNKNEFEKMLQAINLYCSIQGYILIKIPKKVFNDCNLLEHSQFLDIESDDGEFYIASFSIYNLNGVVLKNVFKDIENDCNLEKCEQFIYEMFLSKCCHLRHIVQILNKYAVKYPKIVVKLAKAAHKACDKNSEFALWQIANQVSLQDKEVIINFATILNRYNHFEKALEIIHLHGNSAFDEELVRLKKDILQKIEKQKSENEDAIILRNILSPKYVLERVDQILYEGIQETYYCFSNDGSEKLLLKPPKEFIGVLNNVYLIGGTRYIFDGNQCLYNDELAATYNKADYRPRLQNIEILSNDKIGLIYRKNKEHKKIKQGILISCEYDFSYGHWVMECLPKIAFVQEKMGIDNIPFLVGSDASPYFLGLIEKICKEYSVVQLEKGYVYEVEQLIYPSNLSIMFEKAHGVLTNGDDFILSQKWIKKVQNQLVGEYENNDKRHRKKIYISRLNNFERKLLNELEITKMLKKLGFEIVDFLLYSHEERKKMMGQAEIVVSSAGSGDLNLIYCRPGTIHIPLLSDICYERDHQYSQLNNIFQIVSKPVFGPRAYRTNSIHDDFTIDIDDLLKTLAESENLASNDLKVEGKI
ncbi:glycosyltransferase 61 family protein [Sporomusa acidovorans]|uniref:Glycosyl transferase family 2 n=1 Tax=Sporomusa acidovorans (strain ATCC 49682 / DSM 3132 / Mol) TaxID=1123286 RepID=A0ABZ3J6P6_SPOA4|nr:glycosyltransferase 61 family protein [Sporomusa acidovorans]OZC23493.1 glycosyl transferase family 2 [Sporomusa acidovorans DSM 3132]SDF28485.1 Glycosyltransferase, GT2 family [Sporomusa acidovorans]